MCAGFYILLVASLIFFISILIYRILNNKPLFVNKLKPGDKLFIWNNELQAFNIIEITLVTKYPYSGDRDAFYFDNIVSGFNLYSRCIHLYPHNYNKLVSDYYKYDGVEYHILVTKNEKKFYKYLEKHV